MATNIAQGWIAVGVWAGFIFVDIVIDGWSEYNHVYAKEKELDRVSIPELRNIDRIITDNPL